MPMLHVGFGVIMARLQKPPLRIGACALSYSDPNPDPSPDPNPIPGSDSNPAVILGPIPGPNLKPNSNRFDLEAARKKRKALWGHQSDPAPGRSSGIIHSSSNKSLQRLNGRRVTTT